MAPVVLLVSNTGWSLYNFRRPLARALIKAGFKPVLVSPRDSYVERLEREGLEWVELPMNRRGLNIFNEGITVLRLKKIYTNLKPVAVHHFTIKCVLYGSIAAKLASVGAVINSVTGLGHVFLDSGFRMRLIRPFVKKAYRLVLTGAHTKVIFQNKDDLSVFKSLGLIEPSKAKLIRSSGVDLERFSPRNEAQNSQLGVLFVGRLLIEKGVFEFVEAARRIRGVRNDICFLIAGAPDDGNPSSVPAETLEKWKKEGICEFLGHVEHIENLIASASLVVLPSYREGVPRTLLEAAAMGKPIVATDVPGCREAVDHQVNGLLVPPRDVTGLANAIETVLNDPLLASRFGQAGREKAIREFNDTQIAESMLSVYRELLSSQA